MPSTELPRRLGFVRRFALFAGRAMSFGLAFFIFAASTALGQGQQLPLLAPEQLRQLQQQYGNPQSNSVMDNVGNQAPMVLQPAVPQQQQLVEQQPSRLEQIISARAGVSLKQFGYDQLGRAAAVVVPQTGSVQDEYILGAGDEIIFVLRGQENSEYRATVDRNGQVILPRLGPVPASGRSFGSFRQDIQAAVRRAYVATDASVSVARMRQISVMVAGAVNNPGLRLVTGLSSALDALMLSGGITKAGSLRDVRIIRGGRQYTIDLYGFLTGSVRTSNMRLADGDRVFVAPLGRTVAVAGLVRNPGIYELPPGQASISAQALVTLAGGREVNGLYLTSLLKIQPDGRTALAQLRDLSAPVSDGEILSLQLQADEATARATLSGGTPLAGNYPLMGGTQLSEVIRRPGALGTSPYTLFGLLARRDPRTLLRTLSAFTPAAVLNGSENITLQPDDIVRPISVEEMRMLVTAVEEYDRWRTAQDEAIRNPVGTNVNNGANRQEQRNNGMGPNGLPQNNGGQNTFRPDGTFQNGPSESGGVAGAILDAASSSENRANNARSSMSELSAFANVPPANGSQANGQSSQAPGTQQGRGPSVPLPPNFQAEVAAAPGRYEMNLPATAFPQLAQQLGVDPLVLVNFLIGNQVTVDGAVRGPGTYFVGPSVTLQDLVLAAGGTTNWADTSGVELITTTVDPVGGRAASRVIKLQLTAQTLATYVVRPRDVFRFNELFNDVNAGTVTLQGEVRFNGSYRLLRGERLSDLLRRAGGLTNSAYPYGTVFLRKSVAALEQEGYQRTAREVQDQLVVAMTRVGNNRIEPSTFAAMQTFVTELRNQKALGRVAIAADPSLLVANPALDPLLESGDVIYIPPRPSTISVLGQVMQPGSFPYRPGETVGDYISRAGGYSTVADEGQVFVVLPDGTARRFEKSWLQFGPRDSLPPGSAIVVPRDVTPLDLRQTLIDVTQILSQLAVSIASVAVLSKQ